MDCICESCARKDCSDRKKENDMQIVISCNFYLKYNPTFADRIRAMSDEELAKFLIKRQYLQVSEALAIVGLKIDPEPSYKAYEETLALLQQPAKEEHHG